MTLSTSMGARTISTPLSPSSVLFFYALANGLSVSPDKVSLSFNGGKDCMLRFTYVAAWLFCYHNSQALSSSTFMLPPSPSELFPLKSQHSIYLYHHLFLPSKLSFSMPPGSTTCQSSPALHLVSSRRRDDLVTHQTMGPKICERH